MQLRRPPALGYTFIEVIAVIFIMVTVGTTLLINFSSSREHRKASKTTLDIIAALREAQTYALGSVSFPGDTTGVTTKSFGVAFTWGGGTYTIFADKDSNGAYDVGTDYPIEIRTFTEGLPVYLLANCPAIAAPTGLSVTFAPPHPIVGIVRDGGTTCVSACVNVIHPDSVTISKVSITQSSGLIDSRITTNAEVFVCP